MDTNLVEGQEYELTVTADPAVQVDTEVTIMRDRGGSDADDADFTLGRSCSRRATPPARPCWW